MTDLEFLRHVLATLAYRTAKAMRGAPESFATFSAESTAKTPLQIVAHMSDLFDWSVTLYKGGTEWQATAPQSWPTDCARFFASLERFDDLLASGETSQFELTRLFQGPVADALTHTGQLTMLRRLHGSPIKSESYSRADVVVGRVSFEQTPPDPKFEFD
jgi:hypothetical protein